MGLISGGFTNSTGRVAEQVGSTSGGFRWFVTAFALSVFGYALLVPPFEMHDEAAHFMRAAQLATGAFPSVAQGRQLGALLPQSLVGLNAAWPEDPPGSATTIRSVRTITHALQSMPYAPDPKTFGDFVAIGSYPSFLYAPQAAGIALVRLAGAAPLAQFYAGRLAGGIFGVAALVWALSLMPFGGRAMSALFVLPGFGMQVAAISADCVIFSITFLSIAVALRATVMPALRYRTLQALLMPALALAKGVYLPIAVAAIDPPSRWRTEKTLRTLGLVAVSAACFVLWYGFSGSASFVGMSYIDRHTLQHVSSAAPADQLRFMVAAPGATVAAFFRTVAERAPAYAIGIIGRFGAFNMLLPLPLYVIGAAVLGLAALPSQQEIWRPTPWQRLLWLSIAAMILVLVHVALYITFAALGATTMEGVQGRYLFPMLPLAILGLRLPAGRGVAGFAERIWPWSIAVMMAGGPATATFGYWRW